MFISGAKIGFISEISKKKAGKLLKSLPKYQKNCRVRL